MSPERCLVVMFLIDFDKKAATNNDIMEWSQQPYSISHPFSLYTYDALNILLKKRNRVLLAGSFSTQQLPKISSTALQSSITRRHSKIIVLHGYKCTHFQTVSASMAGQDPDLPGKVNQDPCFHFMTSGNRFSPRWSWKEGTLSESISRSPLSTTTPGLSRERNTLSQRFYCQYLSQLL